MACVRGYLSALLLGCSALGSVLAQNLATLPVPRAEAWWQSRHGEILQRVRTLPDSQLVFVGDSITQNYEKAGPAPNEVFAPIWQEFFAQHHALNLGYSGDQTQHVLWRLAHGEVDGLSPGDVVLLIGTNNTASTTAPQTAVQVEAGIEEIVDSLHARLPNAKVLLIEILPSAVSSEKSAKDTAVNAAVRRHYAGSAFVRCLDLSSLYVKNGVLDATLFYDPELVPVKLPLHPNTQGQRMMARAVAEALYGVAR